MTNSLSQQEAEVRVMDAWLVWGAVPDQNPASRAEAQHGPARKAALGGHSQSRRMVCQLEGKKTW